MIRGPVLPHSRDGLWALVASRLEAIESGLTLVMKDLECSSGQLGPVDGLLRDASGAPVLMLLAVEGDALLAAKAMSAVEFLDRVGDSLSTGIPEGCFRAGAAGRVLVVSTGTAAAGLESLLRLCVAGIELCRLEPFRIAGMERFAVRWFEGGRRSVGSGGSAEPAAAAAPAAAFSVDPAQQGHWRTILQLCERLDAGVRVDGDRFWRRITWQGRMLGQVVSVDGVLHAIDGSGARRTLLTAADIREFGDSIVRRYAVFAGLVAAPERAGSAPAAGRDVGVAPRERAGARPAGGDTLRSSLAGSRISPEEYSALNGPARSGPLAEIAGVADDVARIVAAQETTWASSPPRTD